MAESLHSVLSAAYEPKLPLTERENLSLREEKTTYLLNLGRRRPCVAYQIDGNIIKSGNRCDCLILAKQESREEAWQSVFVELKGTDVIHALKQIDATLDNPLFRHPTVKEVHARIVAKSFPANKANTAFEKERRNFKKKHKNCSFKQVKSNQPDLIA